jgi:phosphatidylinositol N-acetylglucosaminyltransferase subunit C
MSVEEEPAKTPKVCNVCIQRLKVILGTESVKLNDMQCHTCGFPIQSEQATVPWRKILYERQPFPDNHVDVTFLSSMVTNANLRFPRFRALAFDTLVISQQISVVVLFLVVFYHFFSGSISVRVLIIIDAALLLIGFGIRSILEEELDLQMDKIRLFASYLASNSKRLFVFVSILFALSPVLKTLTRSYSSDTIYALTMGFCAIHIFLYDYSYISIPESSTK